MESPVLEGSTALSMLNALARNWWLVVLRGVFAVLFALAAFFWPALSWLVLVTIFGIYAIVDGIVAVASGLSRTKQARWWAFLLEGLVSIAVGVAALIWPGLASFAIIILIANWAILTGIFEIVAAIRLRHEISNEWLLVFGGVLSIALGILLFIQPAAAMIAITWTLGAYALFFGVLLISLGIRLRRENLRRDNGRQLRPA